MEGLSIEEARQLAELWPKFRMDYKDACRSIRAFMDAPGNHFEFVQEVLELDILAPKGIQLNHE